LKTLLLLVLKDLKRDLKHPWSLVLIAFLPVVMTGLIATIFGEHGGSTTVPTIRVAVLDEDRGLMADALRLLAARHGAAREVQLHFVKNRDQGLRLLEQREASILVVLPRKMTENLVGGRPSTIELYENPAEQYLPKILYQQISLLADGLSGAADGLRDASRNIWDTLCGHGFPTKVALAQAAWQYAQKLRRFGTSVAAPSIELKTVSAANYRLEANHVSHTGPRP
jgi:hypothetical protein